MREILHKIQIMVVPLASTPELQKIKIIALILKFIPKIIIHFYLYQYPIFSTYNKLNQSTMGERFRKLMTNETLLNVASYKKNISTMNL